LQNNKYTAVLHIAGLVIWKNRFGVLYFNISIMAEMPQLQKSPAHDLVFYV